MAFQNLRAAVPAAGALLRLVRAAAYCALLTAALFAQQSVDVPSGTAPWRRLKSYSAGAFTTADRLGNTAAHGLSVNDRVFLGLVYVTGSPDPVMANVNGAYRVASVPTTSTFTLKETGSESAVTLTGTYLTDSGFVSQSAQATLVGHPRVLFGGPNDTGTCFAAASKRLGNFTSIVVASNVGTINLTCNPQYVAGRTRVQVRGTGNSSLNGKYTIQTTPSSTTATITTSGVADGTYNATNTTVSGIAVDSEVAVWTGINSAMSSYSTTSRAAASVVNTQDAYGTFIWMATFKYLIDPTDTTSRDYSLNSLRKPNRLFPMQMLRLDGSAQRNGYSDYPRGHDPMIAASISIMEALGELSAGEKTALADAIFTDSQPGGGTCTYRNWPSNGSGNITIANTGGNTFSITGNGGTTFTSSATVGGFLSVTSGIETAFAEITAINSDTSMNVIASWDDFSGSGVSYKLHSAPGSGDCGRWWLLGNLHGGASYKEDRRYPDRSANWGIDRWTHASGNNQGYTAFMPYLAYAETFVGIDSRADYWYSVYAHMNHALTGYDILSGGGCEASNNYAYDRTCPARAEVVRWLTHTDSALLDSWQTYLAQAIKDGIMTMIFSFPAVGHSANANSLAPTSGSEDLAGLEISAHYPSVMRSQYGFDSTESRWAQWLFANQWTSMDSSGQSYYPVAAWRATWFRPDVLATDYRSAIGLQWSGGGDNMNSTVCATMRIECDRAMNTWAFSRSGFSSASDWTLQVSAHRAELPPDYVTVTQGAYKLWQQSSPKDIGGSAGTDKSFSGCLLGSDDISCGDPVDGNSVAGANSLYFSNAITNQTSSTGVGSDGRFRWGGTARTGDPQNRYFYVAVNATRAWQNNGLTPTNPSRSSRHFYQTKGSGKDVFLFIYDTGAWGSNAMQQCAQFRMRTHTTSFSGGVATVTNSDNFRAITKWLAPAGANTLALIDAGTGSYTRLIRACGSTDGSTAANVTSFESMQTTLLTTNATSDFTLTGVAPSGSFVGGVAEGANSTALFLIARDNALATSMPSTSITLPNSKTAQVLIAGLDAGSYSVTRGGTEIFTCTVTTGDNTCYGEVTGTGSSANFAVVAGGGGGGGGSSSTRVLGPVVVRGGAVIQ